MGADRWRIDPDRVVWEILDGEAVIVDLAAGHYHAATGVAATVWRAIDDGHDLAGIVTVAVGAHPDAPPDAAEQIAGFIGELHTAGLLVTADAADPEASAARPASSAPTDRTGQPWSPPCLESHDDLEDLLLLDPVHDVTADGWPNAAVLAPDE
jgi:hypothetical protein